MTDPLNIIDPLVEDILVDCHSMRDEDAPEPTATYAEVEAEIRLDLMADLVESGPPTYSRPGGHPARPASGPVES